MFPAAKLHTLRFSGLQKTKHDKETTKQLANAQNAMYSCMQLYLVRQDAAKMNIQLVFMRPFCPILLSHLLD